MKRNFAVWNIAAAALIWSHTTYTYIAGKIFANSLAPPLSFLKI